VPDIHFIYRGTSFLWDSNKNSRNLRDHGISFEHAVQAFFDPFARVVDGSRNDQARDKVIGYLDDSRLFAVVHLELDGDAYRIISAWPASPAERELYDS